MERRNDREQQREDAALPWSRMRWEVALTVASGTLIAAAGAGGAHAASAPADDTSPGSTRPADSGAQQVTAVAERARAVARPVQQAGAASETLTVGRRPARLRPAQLSTPPTVSTPPVRPRPTTNADVQGAMEDALPVSQSGAVHTVRRGETLWSIASDTLGEYATPSRVAALVQRLWEVNSSGIASGRPHLLAEGERIVLP